jgi:leucyl/phenylalanyl-tRNA---protein transferase
VRTIRLPPLAADPAAPFPDPSRALRNPDGLLALGGDLSPTRLLNAYRHGIFPWYSDGQPILWWSPDPRMTVVPSALHLGRRFRRWLRHSEWTVTTDRAFDAVIEGCARTPRSGQAGTWITAEMAAAYRELHRQGHAHSVEVRDGERLLGGIYGVAIGRVFFGESMFGTVAGASKVAITALAQQLARWNFVLLDGQVESEHLHRLGFRPQPRSEFLAACAQACAMPGAPTDWNEALPPRRAAELA